MAQLWTRATKLVPRWAIASGLLGVLTPMAWMTGETLAYSGEHAGVVFGAGVVGSIVQAWGWAALWVVVHRRPTAQYRALLVALAPWFTLGVGLAVVNDLVVRRAAG